jgi:hypothetical protein
MPQPQRVLQQQQQDDQYQRDDFHKGCIVQLIPGRLFCKKNAPSLSLGRILNSLAVTI